MKFRFDMRTAINGSKDMQKPLPGVKTAYALARERLLEEKELEIQALCTSTGMDYESAAKQIELRRKQARYGSHSA